MIKRKYKAFEIALWHDLYNRACNSVRWAVRNSGHRSSAFTPRGFKYIQGVTGV